MSAFKNIDFTKETHKALKKIRLEAKAKVALNEEENKKLLEFKDRLARLGGLITKSGDSLVAIVKEVGIYTNKMGTAGVRFIMLLAIHDVQEAAKDQAALNGIDKMLKGFDFFAAGDLSDIFSAIKEIKNAGKGNAIFLESYNIWKNLYDQAALREKFAREGGRN